MPFGELCQRRRRGYLVTPHSLLSHVFSSDPLLFVYFLSFFCLLFFFFFFISPPHPPRWLHHGRRRSLHSLILYFFSYSFILFGCSSASPLMRFCFFFLLPTPARPRCLYPCRHHHLPLSYGSFAFVGPSLVESRALPISFFLVFFLSPFVCTTMKPPPSTLSCRRRPRGHLVQLDLALVVPWATLHPLWLFMCWSCRFLCEATKVFQPYCIIVGWVGSPWLGSNPTIKKQ